MRAIGVIFLANRPVPALRKPVRAGFPSPADDYVEDGIDLQGLLVVNRAATFIVRVSGHSMVEARLFDGDLAVVDRSLTPRNGDVVVVDIDGERSFKVWSRRGARVSLSFANPRFPDFRLDPGSLVEIWGVVSASVSPGRRAA